MTVRSLFRLLFARKLCNTALSLGLGSMLTSCGISVGIDHIQPLDDAGVTLLVAREAARDPTEPDRFKVKADVWLSNTGTFDLTVASVTTDYPGTTIAPNSDPPTPGQTIPVGSVGRVRVFDGITRELTLPAPPDLHVTVGFVGTNATFDFTVPLTVYANETAQGSYRYPMDGNDLRADEYWVYDNRHIDNFSTVRDRYAYDVGVRRWNGSGWTDLGTDPDGNTLPGTSNSDFLAFGKPLYAVADGVILRCTNGVTENVPGVVGSGGGNELWIRHGTEVVRYAHFQAGSLSATICPFSDGNGHDVEAQNILVTAGQKLGLSGNTGQSTAPHLHVSVHSRKDPTVPFDASFEGADSRPLAFRGVWFAADKTNLANIEFPPALHKLDGKILPSFALFRPPGMVLPNLGDFVACPVVPCQLLLRPDVAVINPDPTSTFPDYLTGPAQVIPRQATAVAFQGARERSFDVTTELSNGLHALLNEDRMWLTPVESGSEARALNDVTHAASLPRVWTSSSSVAHVVSTATGLSLTEELRTRPLMPLSPTVTGRIIPDNRTGGRAVLTLTTQSVLLVGGRRPDGSPANSLWRYQLDSKRWEPIAWPTLVPADVATISYSRQGERLAVLERVATSSSTAPVARLHLYDLRAQAQAVVGTWPEFSFDRVGMVARDDGSFVLVGSSSQTEKWTAWSFVITANQVTITGRTEGHGALATEPINATAGVVLLISNHERGERIILTPSSF